jgi:thioredoxin 1
MSTKTVTDQSFATDVLGSDGPVLVDFWAEWCGPCRMIAPALEEISNELGDKVTIAKLNIDENPDVPGRYGVRGIPPCCCSRAASRSRRRSARRRAARSSSG